MAQQEIQSILRDEIKNMKIVDLINIINADKEKYRIEERISRIYELDADMTSYERDVLEKKVVAQLAAVQYIVSYVLDSLGEDFVEVIYTLDIERKFYYHKASINSIDSAQKLNGYLFLEKVEELKNAEGERLFGQYYTPENIVEMIIKLTDINFEELQDKRLIDPSCGAGVFYLKIIDILINKKKTLPVILSIVNDTFWGYDIDEISLFLTKLCICVHLKTELEISINEVIGVVNSLNNHFVHTNTLLNDTNTFDYVIGNPPYFKIKNSKTIKNKYKDYIRGQSNAYALFIMWALNNLNQEGKICLIIPQSIRNGWHFELVRKHVSQFKVTNIYCLDARNRKNVFKDVEQAVMIMAIEKNNKNNFTTVFVDKNNYVTEEKYRQEDIISQARFLIPESYDVFELIKILDGYPKFKDIVKDLVFGNGLFVWNQKKKEIVNAGKDLPIIYANYIRTNEFSFIPQKNNSDEERKPFCPKKDNESFVFTGNRLLVKRTSSMDNFKRIKACLINDEFLREANNEYFVENHVNVLYQKENKQKEIDINKQLYILAYLCSDLANFYIFQTNGNTQVSANELNNLPFNMIGRKHIIEEMKKKEPNWQLINSHFYKIFKINKALQKTILKIKGEE